MPKIIIQAGHEGRTSGSTGAPNEQAFNIDISNQVAEVLRSKGFEVKRVNADPKSTEIAGDWDLFLAIHYDADIYGTGGFFSDFPEPSTDGATQQSQSISKFLTEEYANITKIVNHPERSNKNTRYYYMWSQLSAKTPCVLIECGVGMHVPDDHTVLHFNRPLVVEGIARGVCKAFNVPYTAPEPVDTTDYKSLYEKVINESQTKLLEMAQIYDKEKSIRDEHIKALEASLQSLQDTEHTWEDVADKYQRKLKALVQEFTDVGISVSTESDVDVLAGAVHGYVSTAETNAKFVSSVLTNPAFKTPEDVLGALQKAAGNEEIIISLTKQVAELKKKETAFRTVNLPGGIIIKFYRKTK